MDIKKVKQDLQEIDHKINELQIKRYKLCNIIRDNNNIKYTELIGRYFNNSLENQIIKIISFFNGDSIVTYSRFICYSVQYDKDSSQTCIDSDYIIEAEDLRNGISNGNIVEVTKEEFLKEQDRIINKVKSKLDVYE